MSSYYIYILRCRDDSLYTGWTDDTAKRLAQHNAGKGAKYTRSRLPVQLIYSEEFSSKTEAIQREHAIKKLSRSHKLDLINPA